MCNAFAVTLFGFERSEKKKIKSQPPCIEWNVLNHLPVMISFIRITKSFALIDFCAASSSKSVYNCRSAEYLDVS